MTQTLERELDQFYTKAGVAEQCMEWTENALNLDSYDVHFEPSAGAGSFFKLMDSVKRQACDIDPKVEGIEKKDYFSYGLSMHDRQSYCVIGNPPFGKNSSQAIKFFNHSRYADAICFIVPLTFRKSSVINKLDINFHLFQEHDLERNSFIFNGEEYGVPCCYQIWKRSGRKRSKIEIIRTHRDFEFCDDYDDIDFLIQRVGSGAGTIKTTDFDKCSGSSHYAIKSQIEPELLKRRISEIDFDEVKFNTAGNPSISKGELVQLYGNI
jgi:hypothetical protein